MSSGKELEAPHTLASLPKPIDALNGRTLASTVYSLSGARKRKRSEIAVAVDGDGLSIYNVQTPRLVTSYALPPQTSFVAPSCSVHARVTKHRPAKRFTYAAIQEGAGSARRQILCFAEEVHATAPTGNPDKTAYTIPAESSAIFSIDVLPLKPAQGSEEDPHEVVVVFEDGRIDSFSADLQTLKWSANVNAPSNDAQPVKVEFAAYTDASAARRGLFKSREDVIAALDPSMEGQSELLDATVLLCLVTRPVDEAALKADGRSLQVCCIRPKTMGGITINRPVVQNILTLGVPPVKIESDVSESQPSYSLHVSTGLLYQLISGCIITYDFSTTTPRMRSDLTVPGTPLQNFIRISSSLLMAASAVSCGLYDVKYNSVQAILPLSHEKVETGKSKKRKQSESVENSSPLTLVNYLAELGLVVGLANGELIGLQVGSDVSASKRSKVKGGLLIDAIGKGVGRKPVITEAPERSTYPLGVCLVNPADSSSKEWHRTRKQLDAFVKEDNLKGFEELFSREVGIALKGKGEEPKLITEDEQTEDKVNGTAELPGADGVKADEQPKINGVSEDESDLQEWNFPETAWDVNLQTKRHKAVYLLSKIFALSSGKKEVIASGAEKPSSLRIRFFPPNAFQWLVWTGFLATDMIRQAMRKSSDETVQAIDAGDVITALFNFDPDMHVLCDVLKGHPGLDVELVVQAIKVLIQSLQATPFPELKERLLTAGSEQPEDAADQEKADEEFETEADAAASALAKAESLLETGLHVRSQSLLEALRKLHTFPPPLISRTLRKSLTHHEILFLMDILRLEIHQGGWIQRYLEEGPDGKSASDSTGDPSDRAIVIIADLLSCALDAVGAGGWLTSGSDRTSEVVYNLRQEISAALEGIHEAAFMKGLLGDFLRFGWKKKTTQQPTNARNLEKKGKPVTVQQNSGDAESRVLPLGFKVEGKVADTRTTLAGEVKQLSKRDIGRQISMRVGKYSFERVVI
ncbi:uncharacterized protein K452DRAFT_233813 [Aplosporella prunicola CBS 121167]|uniref:Utp8 beta-propeller domain-containing protein n=1 Tax=Aplosporella prunicola CBS 121167 TaxID=1176127 RepID=A0A6A6B6Y4_9PEZI|nr:uncharacterized protein K452DRAFT_233813 [Aplosporella prunicola CBS 121167]KAF2138747.1 hypothetical protein K452DRAFT_233813 [Aplosporella prunicola CBS 121167]